MYRLEATSAGAHPLDVDVEWGVVIWGRARHGPWA